MKNSNKEGLVVILFVFVTTCILVLVNYFAITHCIGNLNLFTAMILIVPMICIGIATFGIGCMVKWNWKKGVWISLVITLISFGVSQFAMNMAGETLDSIENAEQSENSLIEPEDELMVQLYEELDKKAYEYMLSQGLISEGEEIYGGAGTIDGKAYDNSGKQDDWSEQQIVSSELYVGIRKSDPVTELMGNMLTFLIGLFCGFAGSLIKNRIGKNE